jgi:N-acetylneuraminic acid mutarotase
MENIFMLPDVVQTALPDIMGNLESFNPLHDNCDVIVNVLMPRGYCNSDYVPSQNKIYVFNGEFIKSMARAITKYVEVNDLNTYSNSAVPDNPFPVKSAGSAVWNNIIYFVCGNQNLSSISALNNTEKADISDFLDQ